MTDIKDGDDIPDADHVLRYCSPIHVREGKIKSTAFEIRIEKNEKDISVHWLEFFNGNASLTGRLNGVQQAIRTHLTIKKNGRLAKIHVGTAKAKISGIDIKYAPLPNGGESHAGIVPKRFSQMDLLELRELSVQLRNCVSDVYPAVCSD